MPRVIVLTNSRARRHDVRRNDYKYFFLRIKRRPCWLQHLCWCWHLPIHFFSIQERDFHHSCSVIAILSCLDLAQLWCPDITWWNTFDSRTAKIFSSWGLRGMVQLNFCNWNVFFSGCCPPHWKPCRPRRSNQFGRSFCNTKRVLRYRVAISLKERRTHPQRYRVAEI